MSERGSFDMLAVASTLRAKNGLAQYWMLAEDDVGTAAWYHIGSESKNGS